MKRRGLLRLRRLVLVLLAAVVGWWGLRLGVGDPQPALDDGWHAGHRIVDRRGKLLRELPSEIGARGRPMELEAMGDRLVLATLVSEDKRFYEHGGVDVASVLRAVGQNVRHLRIVSGASTVTQQLVKLLDNEGRPPSERRDLGTKIREAARAQNLEATMSKRAILEAYLNRLSYGRGVVGPAAAAESFYGVSASELSWAQAALLAVLPRAPSYLDPHRHPERAVKRQRALLEALHEQGFMDDADLRRALAERLELREPQRPFEAPHFTVALEGGAHGGLASSGTTQTTLDLELQRDLEALVQAHRVRLAPKRASGAAVLVVDNATGEALAYLGNADWADERAGQVDLVRARRQPGSTLKPFVYAMAFENGLQPSEMLADVPTRFGEEDGSYAPSNFDGSFVGPISAREALAGSLNVPAVRLAAGLERGALLAKLHELGMRSLNRSAEHYGLALALGSGEISLAELAAGYVALARGGDAIPLRFTVADEASLGVAPPEGRRVFTKTSAAAIADSLSDPHARLRGLGNAGPFDLGFPVAVKTGTSSGYRDTWAVGYTRERTVAVWVGNADGRATDELTGGSGAGPLFADAMRRAMRDLSREPLFAEDQLVSVEVCPLSGLPAGPSCPHAVSRRWLPHEGEPHRCALHRHASSTPDGFRCDVRGRVPVVVLPEAFDGWLAAQGEGAPGWDPEGRPWLASGALEGCQDDAPQPRLTVLDPPAGAVLLSRGHVAERLELRASLEGAPHRSMEVEFVIDGEVVARSGHPFEAQVALERGDHVLEVRPADPEAPVRLAQASFSVR